jgi:hypothetical protein
MAVIDAQALDEAFAQAPRLLDGDGLEVDDAQARAIDEALDVLPAHKRPRLWSQATPQQRMAFARVFKVMHQERRRTSKLSGQFHALATAWDKLHGLRQGEKIDRRAAMTNEDIKAANKSKQKGMQPLQWTCSGLIRLAAASVGKRAFNRSGLGESNKTLSALSSVAHICTTLLANRVSRAFAAWRHAARSLWVVARHHDATPVKVFFGSYRQQVSPIARYLAKGADGKWARLTMEAFQKLSNKAVPSIGVVELFAQTATVCHTEFQDDERNKWTVRDIKVQPKVLASSNASCIFSALESVPEISIPKINELSKYLTIYCERPDGASSNKRKMAATGCKLGPNVLYDHGTCIAHGLQRVINHSFDEDRSVGDIYATQLVVQLHSHQNRLVRELKDLLMREPGGLHIVDSRVTPPAPDLRKRTTIILQRTVGMSEFFVQADATLGLLQKSSQLSMNQRIEKLVDALNGDVRTERLTTYSAGECREVVVERVLGAMLEGGLLLGCVSGTPKKGRWGSRAKSMAEQAAGFMMHDVLSRCFLATFRGWDDGDPGRGDADAEAEDNDFRLMIKRKVHRVRCRLQDPMYKRSCMLHTWCATSLSHLSQVLQRLDDAGGVLWEVCLPERSLFRKTCKELTSTATQPISQGDLDTLFWYFRYRWDHCADRDTAKEEEDKMIRDARLLLVGQGAQVWWRCILVFEGWPFKFLRMFTATSEDEIERIVGRLERQLDRVSEASPCCLDKLFTRKVDQHVCMPILSNNPWPWHHDHTPSMLKCLD